MSNAELYAEAYPDAPTAAALTYGDLPRRHYTNNKVWPATITSTTTTTTTSHLGEEEEDGLAGGGANESSAFFENVERKFYYNNNNIYKIFLFF